MPSLKKVKARYGEVMPNKVKLYLKEGVNKAQNIFSTDEYFGTKQHNNTA